jgi:hypothetical protein
MKVFVLFTWIFLAQQALAFEGVWRGVGSHYVQGKHTFCSVAVFQFDWVGDFEEGKLFEVGPLAFECGNFQVVYPVIELELHPYGKIFYDGKRVGRYTRAQDEISVVMPATVKQSKVSFALKKRSSQVLYVEVKIYGEKEGDITLTSNMVYEQAVSIGGE